jgi:beta-mannanase
MVANKRTLLTALLVTFACAGTAEAQVYSWRDRNGKLSYGSTCPAGARCKIKLSTGGWKTVTTEPTPNSTTTSGSTTTTSTSTTSTSTSTTSTSLTSSSTTASITPTTSTSTTASITPTTSTSSSTTTTKLGVYRWDAPDGPANVDAFSQWLGTPVTIATAFEAMATWDDIDGASWQLGPWSRWVQASPGRNLSLAIPLLPTPTNGTSLASCSAGQYDVYWRNLANNLANHGLNSIYLRLGWEMDGAWFVWGAPPGSGKEASFAGCFRRVVQVMRQTQPLNQWKFVWNPSIGGWKSAAYFDATWPGDAYVDVVGVDMYDQSWVPNTYPYPSTCDAACRLARQQTVWNYLSGRLNALRDFAAAHGKPMAFPEWAVLIRSDGHGGGDNPYFIQKMHDFIMDPRNNVVFHSYLDASSTRSHDHCLTCTTTQGTFGAPTRMPNAAALYKLLFGAAP